MRRADKQSMDSVVIRVRESCGTYIASGGGQRTSCTQGAQNAAVAHAFKLFKGPRFTIAELAEPNTWRATSAEGKGL